MIQFEKCQGDTICYVQPTYENPLAELEKYIWDLHNSNKAKTLSDFSDRFYYLETNKGYIKEIYTASQYYIDAFKRIRDNLHTISISKENIKISIGEINDLYKTAKATKKTAQTCIHCDKEIYKLRSDIFTYTIATRAIFDILTTLSQTIYWSKSRPASRVYFSKFYDAVMKGSGDIDDPILKEYFEKNFEWYFLLKDVRDYIVHVGALHFKLTSHDNSRVTVEMFKKINVMLFIKETSDGFNEFLNFINKVSSPKSRVT